jgi:hypothetical protein
LVEGGFAGAFHAGHLLFEGGDDGAGGHERALSQER